jgi:hypothetical protein
VAGRTRQLRQYLYSGSDSLSDSDGLKRSPGDRLLCPATPTVVAIRVRRFPIFVATPVRLVWTIPCLPAIPPD